jgi:molybdate transport system ATP-binding protein
MIRFRDSYADMEGTYYLQKRWNTIEIEEETPTVREILRKALETAEARAVWSRSETDEGSSRAEREALLRDLTGRFGLDRLQDEYVISLSSGETRKLQLTAALLSLPQVLILDNPFLGLDAGTRAMLSDLLGSLASRMRLHLVLLLSHPDQIPPFVTHVIPVEGGKAGEKVPVAEYRPGPAPDGPSPAVEARILSFPHRALSDFYPSGPAPEIVRCEGVTIRYGARTILDRLDWVVREGEHWALRGENGSGKSTLLSLVCADNPQAYACRIALFGHPRGSGESIWEIKRHIGYVSPEMHRAYRENLPALHIVASGLFDTVGLCLHPGAEQLALSREWMAVFGIEDLADRPYLRLSSGEQRLCLLARAFVKDPELLILDEPMHGLDLRHIAMVREIIDSFVKRPHKTLVMVSHYESELPSCIDRRLVLTRQ